MKSSKSINDIQSALLKWFNKNGRHWIPWKLKKDGTFPKNSEVISPYGIWIAEVMLQQTKLNIVLPYWEKWIQVFPTLDDLADSDEQQVLLLWQGLGYYSRAKRIYQSSKLLIDFIGKNNSLNSLLWPSTLDKWVALPGIGLSTAGSILSSAFDLPYPILDANVKRVLARLLASPGNLADDKKRLWDFSNQLVLVDRPRDLNQALMDFGSSVCTISNPSCLSCPIQKYCLANLEYHPIAFPRKVMKKIIPTQEIGIGIVFNPKGELLIAQRLENSSMGGMWEFPGGKKESSETIEMTIEREITEEIGIRIKVGEKLISFIHIYSHKKLHFTVHICEFISGKPKPLASQNVLWVDPSKLVDFPFPAANTKIIDAIHRFLG